jgi:hypothetical protein
MMNQIEYAEKEGSEASQSVTVGNEKTDRLRKTAYPEIQFHPGPRDGPQQWFLVSYFVGFFHFIFKKGGFTEKTQLRRLLPKIRARVIVKCCGCGGACFRLLLG